MTPSELRILDSFLRHVERVFDRYPPPRDCDTTTYNAYRIANRTEIRRLKSIIEKYRQQQNV